MCVCPPPPRPIVCIHSSHRRYYENLPVVKILLKRDSTREREEGEGDVVDTLVETLKFNFWAPCKLIVSVYVYLQ